MADIVNLIKENYKNQSGIIYCLSRKECDSTAELMSNEGIKAISYHAGLTDQKRNDVQMKWITNKVNVIVIITMMLFVFFLNLRTIPTMSR